MDFPTVYTNFWDAVIAVPIVMALTQIIKVFFHTPKVFVPLVALFIGLLVSIFISHRGHLTAGIFMGWFYGYAAIGSYASLKTSIFAYLRKVRRE